MASQTLMSGKINEVIDRFAGQIERLAPRGHDRRIQRKAPPRADGSRLVHRALDALQDELARGASNPRSPLMQPAVQVPRKIDAGPDGAPVHRAIVARRLK